MSAGHPEPDALSRRLPTMNRRMTLIGIALALLVAACRSGGTSSPSASPPPTPGPARSVTELKLALISTYGDLWYCDRDFYPIQRQDEIQSAKERWSEVTADAAAFKAIADAAGIDPAGPFTDDQRLTLYRSWKVVQAIALDPIGNDTYRFDYLAQPKAGGAEGMRAGGTIRADGSITVEQQAAATEPICPICLARGTLIETPNGGVAVEDLRIGDPIWTLDASGRRIEGMVIALGSTVAPVNHRVVRLILADGRTATASPGHPLADGRDLGDLRVGDAVDGSVVASAVSIAYDGARTFDLVVSGQTGTYLVDGIPLGSTLRP